LIKSTLSVRPEPLSAISRERPGFGPRSIRKWLKFSTPPDRHAAAPKPCSPAYFQDYLSRRWAEGCVRGRTLLQEIKLRYTGSFSHLERLLAKWRSARSSQAAKGAKDVTPQPPSRVLSAMPTTAGATRAVDPATGWLISPIVAASLCIKPRGLLTRGQAAKVDALKSASPDFTAMRGLVMRFRGILRSKDIRKFDAWLNDAQQSGIYAMQRFGRTLQRDIDAVRNALIERWSNGQTEGQINRLKTLKRATYGRAGAELLRPGCCRSTYLSTTEFEEDPIKCLAGGALSNYVCFLK
jgi:hypothetical protein